MKGRRQSAAVPPAAPGLGPRPVIRRARRIEEMEQVAELEAAIWGSWEMAAPASLLKAIAGAGGLVLLARIGTRPVGFAFGFTGRDPDGRAYHRSHAAGVLPEARDLRVGTALKLAQRRYALALGLDRMVWTFDPTQLRNAHFNLHRLGAVGRGFHRDYYGARGDAINQGRPSDRLVAEWFLDRRRHREVAWARRSDAVPVPVPRPFVSGELPDPRAQRRLRRGLERALGSGLALVDYDRETATYWAAPLPSTLPPPAE